MSPVRKLRDDEKEWDRAPEHLKAGGPPQAAEASLTPPLTLDPAGTANSSIASATNAVRHRIRDGVPTLDTVPVPFNMVRLENLSDEIPLTTTPAQTVFQARYSDIPTQRYMNAQIVPNTLVAYMDGSWVATHPVVDVDQNGNFMLPFPPINTLLVTYAWQYLSDGEIHQFIDEARQWLREFKTVDSIPDGLVPALVSYSSYRALSALANSANLAPVKAGDSDIDWSKLSTTYLKLAQDANATACKERELFYTQGPEALDPSAVDVSAPIFDPYIPPR